MLEFIIMLGFLLIVIFVAYCFCTCTDILDYDSDDNFEM